jgi:epoxyqueuosine reductase
VLTPSAIKTQARSLGFDVCGIAPATALPELARLHDWLARGHAGEMSYLARSADTRADIQRFLPGARSVIVTGTNYWTGPTGRAAGVAPARVARYAQGEDYHRVLATRLDALLAWMQQHTTEPFEAAPFVDKHWVQERIFAAYAGLGWIGKHSLVINRDLGSWLFLAGLATTLPLTPDALQDDQCGACTLCLDACPTGAIVAPRDVDARACLSYLTIELDGPVPDAAKALVADHLYGCDVCQDVCPWNLAPAVTTDPAWQARAGRDAADAAELWQRPDDALHTLVAESAMTHVPLAQLRRNLALVLGNAGAAAAVDVLPRPGGGVKNAAFSAAAASVTDAVAWAESRR